MGEFLVFGYLVGWVATYAGLVRWAPAPGFVGVDEAVTVARAFAVGAAWPLVLTLIGIWKLSTLGTGRN